MIRSQSGDEVAKLFNDTILDAKVMNSFYNNQTGEFLSKGENFVTRHLANKLLGGGLGGYEGYRQGGVKGAVIGVATGAATAAIAKKALPPLAQYGKGVVAKRGLGSAARKKSVIKYGSSIKEQQKKFPKSNVDPKIEEYLKSQGKIK